MVGQTISHYRVLEKLGEGGMGIVYKAEDVKLGRPVALKFLPSEGLNDEERKGRFLHEARAAAALDHPNICTVYEIDEVDGRLFMAMPFLAGRTLDRRIEDGPLPIHEAVEIALQLADALGEAHAKGIVHRDVKPSNVMLLEREDKPVQVKLMDFGLARLSEATRLTREGVQPGTVQYMSPEQISGEKIDHRTDIWSLGVVLYEMIAGRPPFEGAYEQALYYGILNEQPEALTGLRTGVPLELERVVLKCLAKRPTERYQQIGEIAVDLRLLGKAVAPREASAVQARASSGERRFGRRDLLWAVSMVLAIGLPFLASRGGDPPVLGRPDLAPLTANAPELSVASAALSPDGRYLAYSDPTGLSLRQIDTGETRTLDLEGDFDPRHVSWFPDSTHLLFVSPDPEGPTREASLWVVSSLGGRPRRLADRAYVAYVSPDGSNIAFLREQQASEIWLADAEGSNPRILYEAEESVAIWGLAWAPDSQAVAYGWTQPWPEQSRTLGALDAAIGVVGLDGRVKPRVVSDPELWQNYTGALPFGWGPDGRLVYGRREAPPNQQTSNLWTVPIDAVTREAMGDAERLTQIAGANHRNITVSSSGRRLAFLAERNQLDIFVATLSLDGKAFESSERLTYDERWDWGPSWTPDSQTVIFASLRAGRWDVYQQQLGSRSATLVGPTRNDRWDPITDPSGQWVLYAVEDRIYREPWPGGPPSEVLQIDGRPWFDCSGPLADVCVVGEQDWAAGQYVFYVFDVASGLGRDLARFDNREHFVQFKLSPDGRRAAVAHNTDQIRIVDFSDGTEEFVRARGYSEMEFVDWAPGNRGFYVNGRPVGETPPGYAGLLHLDWEGRVTVLEKASYWWHTDVSLSPDGRRLAYSKMRYHANAWMMEDF